MGRLTGGPGALARALLREADDAARGRGRESLHEFRVALRRLWVLLGSGRGRCGAAKADRRALRALLKATNPARDAQVELAWLRERAPAALLRRARASLRPTPPASLGPRWAALRRRLGSALEDAGGRWSAGPARRASAKLARRLARFEARGTPRALHKARVAAKTLRYRLEPLGRVPGLPDPARLKALQRALGAVHDGDVLRADLGRWAKADPALAAPAARASAVLRAERGRRLAEARRLWRGPGFTRR